MLGREHQSHGHGGPDEVHSRTRTSRVLSCGCLSLDVAERGLDLDCATVFPFTKKMLLASPASSVIRTGLKPDVFALRCE